ncbi:MAG: M56 family metallopeptidase [Bryobacteraceae bacterium]
MNLTEALGWMLIHFLWQGAAVALLYGLAAAALRRAGARSRYVAGCVAMLLMAIAPLVTLVNIQDTPRIAASAAEPGAAVPLMMAGLPAPSAAHDLSRRLQDYFPLMITLWLIGVGLLSTWSAVGWLGTLRLRRRRVKPAPDAWLRRLDLLALRLGISRRVRLLESALVRVPSVIGLLRPVILIPVSALANLPPRHIEALLAHELAHIRRHDYLVNLLQTAIETVLFYHPAVWWVSRRIRIEREHCCDDVAVAACGDVVTYARALTGLEETRLAIGGGYAMAADGGSLLSRIRRLASGREPEMPISATWTLAVSLLLALTMWAGPGHNEQGEPQQPPAVAVEPAPARASKAPSTVRPRAPKAVVIAQVTPQAPAAPAPSVTPRAATAPAAPFVPRGAGFLASLAAAGYGDLSVDEIIELKNQGVGGDYVLAMKDNGFGRLTPRQLIDLRQHNVSADYLRMMSQSGISDLAVEKVRDLRNNNVNPEHIRDIHALGFGKYTTRETIELSVNGVRPELFRALKDYGLTQVTAREAIDAKNNGLKYSDVQEARNFGSKLTLKQILKLKQAGVL